LGDELTKFQTISSFTAFTKSIEAIYLVEASPYLQKQQAKLLSGTEDLQKSGIGLTAPCKYIPGCKIEWCEDIRLVPKGTYCLLHFSLRLLAFFSSD
jgi:NADH dehydrogenase [ubiquinone] 1 alpha subcomplex assembly factor 7